MKTAFNVMMKNEGKLLKETLKIWKTYPVDLFIFYDDNSDDNSIEIINQILPKEKIIILNDNLESFNEGYNRERMLEVSRENNVEIVFAIDCDELLTSNIISDWSDFLKIYEKEDMHLFWYNCVNDSITQYRNDPQYVNNYRSFVLPLKHTGNLNKNEYKYHTPRTPYVNLPKTFSKDYGIIHLQAVNRRYYVIKQLWYKHHELIVYNHSIEFINSRYDPVINNLEFNPRHMTNKLIDGIDFDLKVFDDLEKEKGYLDFIKQHYNENLITFGKEYL